MYRTSTVLAVGIAALTFNGANAEFCVSDYGSEHGFLGLQTIDMGGGVYQLHAVFESSNHELLNAFDFQIENPTSGWVHSDFVNGSWAPQYVMDDSIDSFVTVGAVGFGSTSTADPEWGADGFNQSNIPAPSIGEPDGPGWYTNNPDANEGQADALGHVLVAQLHFAEESEVFEVIGSYLQIGFEYGDSGPVFGGGSFFCFPTPGTLAVMGLVPLLATRKRR